MTYKEGSHLLVSTLAVLIHLLEIKSSEWVRDQSSLSTLRALVSDNIAERRQEIGKLGAKLGKT